MRKVKLILGTYNSQPPGENNSVIEEFYQKAYKTFLTTMYNFPNFNISLFYSGSLFEWLEEYHPEFITVLQEMINSKQVEMLSGGYYDPALTLLPISDRVGQMETLTTYIRKTLSKKPRGCYLTESVWDSSLIGSLKSCGFEYIYLDDNQFLSSGISGDALLKPVVTEDQGKTITVIPVNSKLSEMFLREKPEKLIEYIQENSHLDGVFTIMLKGEYINSAIQDTGKTREWLETFNKLIEENSSWIESINPGKYVKQIQGTLERTYFPQYTINGMRNKPLPIVSQRELNRLNRHLGALGDVSHWINSGFFKQFISRYYDSSLLYSKMLYINLLVSQIKGDRSRKKSAREELWRAQSHYVYWHGSHLGIYEKNLRERSYSFLIEAERSTREKGIFKTGINHFDIDFDGLKEALYQGDYYNSYISQKGGILFQLDHIKSKRNLLSTVMRIEESYHNSENSSMIYDNYPKKMFHDHFLQENLQLSDFDYGNYKELGTFIDSIYDYDSLNRENTTVNLKSKGNVLYLGVNHNVTLEKKYLFTENGMVLTYSLENHDDLPLKTTFSPEFNLSLSDISGTDCATLSSDRDHLVLNSSKEALQINHFVINDILYNVKLNFSFSQNSERLWTIPQFSDSMSNGEINKLYQFTTFLPQWDIKINPRSVWTLAINLTLG